MIRLAVAGAGYFARYHLDAWQRIDGVEVCAVADADRGRARALAAPHDIDVHDNVEQMLAAARPDVIDIVTPPETHHRLATAAAALGVHVICQKPLAPTLREATDLVDEMEQYDIRFMVHENWRWQPWYRTIRQLLDDGTAGAPLSASFVMRTGDGWQPDAYLERQPYFRHYPRFLLHETGVHLVDTFRYLFGRVETVYARTQRRNREIAGEDAALVVLEMEDGVVVALDASRYNEPDQSVSDPRYTFGSLRVDTENGHISLATDGRVTWQALGRTAVEVLREPSTLGFAGDSVRAVQEHFVRHLRSGAHFESEGRDYLKTIGVIEACYESAEQRRVVAVADSSGGGQTRPT